MYYKKSTKKIYFKKNLDQKQIYQKKIPKKKYQKKNPKKTKNTTTRKRRKARKSEKANRSNVYFVYTYVFYELLKKIEEMNFKITHTYGLTEVYGPAVVCEWQKEWDKIKNKSKIAELKSRQGVKSYGN